MSFEKSLQENCEKKFQKLLRKFRRNSGVKEKLCEKTKL